MLLVLDRDVLDMQALYVSRKGSTMEERKMRSNLRSSLAQDLRDTSFTSHCQARSNGVLLNQIHQLQSSMPTVCGKGDSVLTDSAISRTACIGCLADAIN